MSSYNILIQKLDEFIRKYYKNQLIRGALYSATALSGFYLTLVVSEYFGHFGITARTLLFYSFIAITTAIVGNWIVLPLAKLYKLGKTLSHEEASLVIGKHFSNIADKLLNVLQLKHNPAERYTSLELLEAAIDQKINEIRPIPFTAAINLNDNIKYAKYLAIPGGALLILILAAPSVLTEPTKRLVKHKEYFAAPAPFQFVLLNKKLQTVQQEDFLVEIKTEGKEIPDQVSIELDGAKFKMEKVAKNHFQYLIKAPVKDTEFNFSTEDLVSITYVLKVLPNPQIIAFEIELKYPGYLNKKDEVIKNTGDFTVPSGTKVTWKFTTKNTDKIQFIADEKSIPLSAAGEQSFLYSSFVFKNMSYQLVSGNAYLNAADTLKYNAQVIADQYPAISLEEKSDSVSTKVVFFSGQIADDYGFKGLWLVYKNMVADSSGQAESKEEEEKRIAIPIAGDITQQNYYYTWDLRNLGLQAGQSLEYYFEVKDNDAINGFKAARTIKKTFKTPGEKELQELSEKSNEQVQEKLEAGLKKAKEIQREIAEINKKLLEKKNLSWEENKKLKDLIQKQKDLHKELEDIQKKQEQNIQQQQEVRPENESMLEKQKELQELMKNILSEDMKKKMEELEKLLQQLDKEKTQQALDEMKMDAKDVEKELDRTLELFKQMEVEQKMEQTMNELDKLAQEEEKLSQKSEEAKGKDEQLKKEQDALNKKFDDLKKEMDELKKKNNELESPMPMENLEQDKEEISKDMENSSDELEKKQNKKAAQSQKSAAQKMSNMKKKMQQMMEDAEGGGGEDVAALRDILENLLQVSFEQEALMKEVKTIDRNNPRYLALIQQQKKIKDDAAMIEDSLFAISKRQPKIQPIVNREIADINNNMNKAIKFMVDRNQQESASRQQYVMTSVNNLALLLSESLQQMMQEQQQKNSQSKPGKGSCSKPGGSGKKKSAAQMKAMQQQINESIQKLKDQMAKEKGKEGQKGQKPQNGQGQPKPGGKPGEKPGDGRAGEGQGSMSEQLAKLAAQQEALRREMQKAAEKFNKDGKGGNAAMQQLAEKMEQTETDLVNKRITEETIRRQQDILTRLLEAEKAEREQDWDEKRESKEGKIENLRNPNEFLEYKGKKQKEAEMLKTVPPAMNPYYKNKVNRYFNQSSQTNPQ
jgi:hypothetical protein